MSYDRKVLVTLFFITFALSTLLSVSGLSTEIADYFDVELIHISIYLASFLIIVGITGLFLPAYLSRFEKKKFFILALVVTSVSTFLQMFINNFQIVYILRIIPAFFYSTAISFALTYIGKTDPNNVNKVVLGITAGALFGASLSIYLTKNFGYNYALLWIALVNILALVLTAVFLPEMRGTTESFLHQVQSAKSELFLISVFAVLYWGVGVSIVYNFFTVLLGSITHVPYDRLSLLFFNGVACVVGTSLIGRFMQKDIKLTITSYPIVFSLLIIAMALCIHWELPVSLMIVIFGFLDGSLQPIAQYTITSAARDAPEFANGFYLFIINLTKTIAILLGGFVIQSWFITSLLIISIFSFFASLPLIIYRVKNYPDVI